MWRVLRRADGHTIMRRLLLTSLLLLRNSSAGRVAHRRISGTPMTDQKRRAIMSIEINGTRALDGFDDDFPDDTAGSSMMRGKLKFGSDAVWRSGDGEEISEDREFVVDDVARISQKWVDQRLVETRILGPGEPYPDIDKLNDAAPPEEWREVFGRRFGPWQKGQIVYLLDWKTARPYTYPAFTVGGSKAVRELRDSVRIARRVEGPDVYPVVTLSDAAFKTSYGARRRPHFNVKRYETLKANARSLQAPPEIRRAQG
jgi:hypothetical protein